MVHTIGNATEKIYYVPHLVHLWNLNKKQKKQKTGCMGKAASKMVSQELRSGRQNIMMDWKMAGQLSLNRWFSEIFLCCGYGTQSG